MTQSFDQPRKNSHQYTKLFMFGFADDDPADWSQIDEAWRIEVVPAYRKPDGVWIKTGQRREWAWFVPQGSMKKDPTKIRWPEWIRCYWDSQAGRWVVVSNSEAVLRIEVSLTETLLSTDATGEAEFNRWRANGEIDCELLPDFPDQITFKNTWKKDAKCGSLLLLETVFQCNEGESEEESSEFWELVEVQDRKARWIQFNYDPETPSAHITVDDYWEGEDPTGCEEGIDVVFPNGEPCNACDVIAFYDPNLGNYVAVNTEAAMQGVPTEETALLGIAPLEGEGSGEDEECGFSWVSKTMKVFCVSDGSAGEVNFNTQLETVLVDVSKDNTEIKFDRKRIYVCKTGTATAKTIPLTTSQVVKQAYWTSTCTLHIDYEQVLTLGSVGSSSINIALPTVPVTVAQSFTVEDCGIKVDNVTLQVCGYSNGGYSYIAGTDCDPYGTDCDPCPDCELEATTTQPVYRWRTATSEWELVQSICPPGRTPQEPGYDGEEDCECAFGYCIGEECCGDDLPSIPGFTVSGSLPNFIGFSSAIKNPDGTGWTGNDSFAIADVSGDTAARVEWSLSCSEDGSDQILSVLVTYLPSGETRSVAYLVEFTGCVPSSLTFIDGDDSIIVRL